jgi:hypothetical protein
MLVFKAWYGLKYLFTLHLFTLGGFKIRVKIFILKVCREYFFFFLPQSKLITNHHIFRLAFLHVVSKCSPILLAVLPVTPPVLLSQPLVKRSRHVEHPVFRGCSTAFTLIVRSLQFVSQCSVHLTNFLFLCRKGTSYAPVASYNSSFVLWKCIHRSHMYRVIESWLR